MIDTVIRGVPEHLQGVARLGATTIDLEALTGCTPQAAAGSSELETVSHDLTWISRQILLLLSERSGLDYRPAGDFRQWFDKGNAWLSLWQTYTCDATIPTAAQGQRRYPELDKRRLNGVAIEPRSILNINTAGLAATVHAVIDNLRRFFDEALIEIHWTAGHDSGKDVFIKVHGPEDIDEALDLLDRFDDEWWVRQGSEQFLRIAIDLA